jgi:alginate O-acetyltransferase complex protein AlgI
MAGFSAATATQPISRYLNHQVAWALVMGVAFSMPLWPALKDRAQRIAQVLPAGARLAAQTAGGALEAVLLVALILVSAVWLAGGTYNPFIYYRF